MDTKSLLIRGTTVDAARRFLHQHQGNPEWGAFMAALSADQRHLMEGAVKPKGWYVVADYGAVVELAAQHLAPQSKEPFAMDLGRFVMEDGVNSLYKVFFRIASPSFVVRLSALFWFQFYKGSRLQVVGRGKRWVHGVIRDAPYCAIDLCNSIKGAMMAALDHAGAKAVKVDGHTCQSAGAGPCEFRLSWS